MSNFVAGIFLLTGIRTFELGINAADTLAFALGITLISSVLVWHFGRVQLMDIVLLLFALVIENIYLVMWK